MSLTFSSFNKGDTTKNGYFRIGFVILQIPPEDILTNRVVNNDKITPLRAGNEMMVKSGQARWDVTVRWVALADYDTSDYSQWEQLQDVVAMFKAAPFVEVESPHLRQVFAKNDKAMATARLAMALRQLRIEKHPDIVDGLSVALTMSLFNFYPYSTDFGYVGAGGASVSADDSDLFRQYIQAWKDANLPPKPQHYQDPTTQPWQNQDPGTFKFLWRQYLPVLDGQPPNFSQLTGGRGSGTIQVSGPYDSMIVSSSQQAGVDPALVKAIMQHESNFDPDAVNPNTSSVRSASVRAAIKSAPDGGLQYVSENNLRPDIGLMQLNWNTAKSLQTGLRPVDLFDPRVNINLAVKYISALQKRGMTDQTVYAYNTGSVKNFITPEVAKKKGFTASTDYRDDVLRKKANWSMAGQKVQDPPTPQQTPEDKAAEAEADATNVNLVQQGWIFDHRTDGVSFFYKNMPEIDGSVEGGLVLTDEEHGDNQYSMYPATFSVLMVNNLAQIPLAGYQYPTYQHIGPSSTAVSVTFTSVGQESVEGDEYDHPGVAELTTMSHALEEQFRRLRTSFRRVSSIHRMQAVFVENQVLNLLGVHSLMLDQLNTETVKESANLVQVEMIGYQYENIYEDAGPFKVNGVGQYLTELKQIINNENPTFTDQEKPGVGELVRYLQEKQNNDWEALARRLLDVAKTHNQIMESFADIGSVPIPNAQVNVQVTTVVLPQADELPAIDTSTETTTYRDYVLKYPGNINGDTYPALNLRAQKLQSSTGNISWMDYLLLTRSIQDQTSTPSIEQKIESALSPQQKAEWTKEAFNAATDVILQFDPLIQKQALNLVNSPKYKDRFLNAVPPTDPAAANKKHGAYRDMGLEMQTLAGRDFNPGMYFTDHNEEYTDIVHKELAATLNATAKADSQANQQVGSSEAITVSTSSKIPGDVESVMRSTNVPGYNMAEAFPTFKLFFMEEDNLGLFFSFDNFFSYSSVLDFEILRPRDKAATAIIQISNLAHLLNHKLFDDTLAGAYERKLERFGKELPDDGGEAVVNQAGDERIIMGGKTVAGTPYMLGPDNREGYPGRKKRVPLKYFPLQTGTKIQIRFGYTNNPDELVPVFTGKITEINDAKADVVTITAQSYLLELMTVSADKSNTDSWWHLSTAAHLLFKKGPAYGGITIFGDSGSTDSVIENLLKNSSASHFGHWQVANPTSPDLLMKGFSWTEIFGKLLSRSGTGTLLSKAGDFLQANYDRSGENIMINQYIQFDGSQRNDRLKRDFYDQQGAGMLTPVEYYVDSQLNMSLWEIMRDVARRYPEFTLCEKQYGFPYGAEATMVFAHPLDWYYARWPLIGDAEKIRAADKDNVLYKQWWDQEGKSVFIDAVNESFRVEGSITAGTAATDETLNTAASGPDGLNDALAQVFQRHLGLFGVTADKNSLLGKDLTNDLLAIPSTISAFLFSAYGQALERARKTLNNVRKSYETYVALNSRAVQDLLKPVRRYHFVDHQSIVHNGMSMNDKIFNAVRIRDKVIFANQNIPSQHIRMLDVTSQINDPKQNVIDRGLEVAYGQSFLKEELGKMYSGEIVLRGIPEIEPYDVLLIMDPSTGMVGPVEVDNVIHSFNMENGFITIVKPRAVVAVNEAASAGLTRAFMNSMYAGLAELNSLFTGQADTKATVAVAGAAAGGVAATAGAVALFGTPPGWAILALGAITAGAATLWWTGKQSNLNTMLLQPITRFGRPWVGGLQGFLVTDFLGSVTTSINQFLADEIYPTLEAYRIAQGIHDDFLDGEPLVPPK